MADQVSPPEAVDRPTLSVPPAPAPRAPADPALEQPAGDPTAEQPADAAPESAADRTSEQPADAAPESAADRTSEQPAGSASGPIAEPVSLVKQATATGPVSLVKRASGTAPAALATPATAQPVAAAPTGRRLVPRVRVAAWVALAVVLVLAAVAAVGLAVRNRGAQAPDLAKTHDCLAGQTTEELRKVSCGDAEVQWTVVGTVNDKSEQEAAERRACAAWPEAQASYWESRNGRTGKVLCLAPITPRDK